MTKRYFICPLLPDDKIGSLHGSIAANNFCKNLISGGVFFDIFPYFPKGRIGKDCLRYDDERVGVFLDAKCRSSLFFSKIAFVCENIKMFKHIEKGSAVWFYNLPYTIMLLFIFLKVFKPSVKCNLIMLDFTPSQKGIRRIIDKLGLIFINKMDGMIKLADSPLFTVQNSTCLPGVVPNSAVKWPEIDKVARSFLLSGILTEEISMLAMVLDTFSKLPDCELHITGSKGNDELLKQYANEYPNIHWHGQLPFNKYLELLHSVTFQLSTRNPQMAENQCNFPSKIMEALHHNRIVISTIPYPQLGNVKYFSVSQDKEDFLNGIKEIAYMHNDTLLTYANQGKLVSKLFGVNVWNDAILKIEKEAL